MSLDFFILGLLAASLVFVFLGFPVAFALGFCSLIYLWVEGFPLTIVAQKLAFSIEGFAILAIPLFMLTGFLMNAARITDRIFDFANLAVGRIPGGLGHVNILASLIFAGMSGSVLADVAGLGRMELRAMERQGYEKRFAVGITLASSVIGPILPPSVPMVLFGILAEISIVGLFLGGVLPALVITACLMIYVFIVGRQRGYYSREWPGLGQVVRAFIKAFPPLLTPVIIVGGMTLGIFSPTEAATVAVLYALFLSALVYRDLGLVTFLNVIQETVLSTAKLLFIITNALLFGWVLTVGDVPQQIAVVSETWFDSPWMFLLMVNIVLLVLGALIENAILLFILGPMLLPVAVNTYGIDPLHFGVIVVLNIMIGQYTPPMGLSLFIMRDVSGLSLGQVSWAVAPFLLPLIVGLMIVTYFPTVVLWLPRTLGF